MATPSSILAWRNPWTEEPGGLQSIGSHRIGHDCSDLAHRHKRLHEDDEDAKMNNTPYFQRACCLNGKMITQLL